jgi:hypothetical protein
VEVYLTLSVNENIQYGLRAWRRWYQCVKDCDQRYDNEVWFRGFIKMDITG